MSVIQNQTEYDRLLEQAEKIDRKTVVMDKNEVIDILKTLASTIFKQWLLLIVHSFHYEYCTI